MQKLLYLGRVSVVWVLVLSTLGVAPYEEPAAGPGYPTDYFQPPVAHTLLLSGTFGELRPNHFHAGIDIKSTKGVAGDPILAAAEGHVSRIRVEAGGYGQSVYIDHPNGYTTVYAHLDTFSPELSAYVKSEQYRQQTFELDLSPGPDLFPLSAGQVIGTMGNTGSSQGVHLHFEVRETATQDPLNPLLFGFRVQDDVPPRMHAIKLYLLDEKRRQVGARTNTLYRGGDGLYHLKGDTLQVDASRVGIGLKVYDHFNKVSNWNGIYSLSVRQDDSLVFSFDLQSFSFRESRYLNAHCDYQERLANNSYYNRCYTLPGNHLSIYRQLRDGGVLRPLVGRASRIDIEASDLAGNASQLRFWLKRGPLNEVSFLPNPHQYVFPHAEGNIIEPEGFYLHMPAGTLYEDLFLNYRVSRERSDGYFSDVHHLHDSRTPVHDYFEVGIRPDRPLPDSLREKAFVAYCHGASVWNCGGDWRDSLLVASVRSLGDYCIMVDRVKPSVQALSFQYDMRKATRIRFRISDNFPPMGHGVGLTYDAWIDDQWVLMEYDRKSRSLTYFFDEHCGKGTHLFRLVVADAAGNTNTFERKFVR
ncbi:MAG: hypothetical protein RLY31_2161 [Bacteroidota bacterium]|jgi:hypothetical protein